MMYLSRRTALCTLLSLFVIGVNSHAFGDKFKPFRKALDPPATSGRVIKTIPSPAKVTKAFNPSAVGKGLNNKVGHSTKTNLSFATRDRSASVDAFKQLKSAKAAPVRPTLNMGAAKGQTQAARGAVEEAKKFVPKTEGKVKRDALQSVRKAEENSAVATTVERKAQADKSFFAKKEKHKRLVAKNTTQVRTNQGQKLSDGKHVDQKKGAVPGPEISSQKQAGHVRGTPQHANRIKQNKTTSTFHGERSGKMATEIANRRGTPLQYRPQVKEFDFGIGVGTGPKGGTQTRVRVHTSPKTGEIHGHPSGPEKR